MQQDTTYSFRRSTPDKPGRWCCWAVGRKRWSCLRTGSRL